MKSSLRIPWVAVAMLLLLSSSALALRTTPEQRLVQRVQIRALRVGDEGELVTELQRMLSAAGVDPGPVDGVYGPKTEAGVRRAQTLFGLEVDGLAGRLTVAALRSRLASGDSPNPASTAATSQKTATAPTLEIFRAGAESQPAQAAGERETVEIARATRLPLTEGGIEVKAVPAVALVRQAEAPAGRGLLALTFNGLPESPTQLQEVLQILAREGMHATFFVTGSQAERHPDLLEQIRAGGHELGNMGYASVDMRQLSATTARAQLRRAQQAITGDSGKEPLYFRPPNGAFDRRLADLVTAEGLRMVLWSNVSVRPAAVKEPARLAEQMEETFFPGAVLMLPLDRPVVAAAVEPVIQRMVDLGYQSEGLHQVLSAAESGDIIRE